MKWLNMNMTSHADSVLTQNPPLHIETLGANQLNMNEALRLAGEMGAHSSDSTANLLTIGLNTILVGMLAAAAVFAVVLIARRYHIITPLRIGVVAAMSLVVGLVLFCGRTHSLPNAAPWNGHAKQRYADPEAATYAILQGIVQPAIKTFGQKVNRLANIQNTVSLPTTSPNPGANYALKMYGLDGWGNRFNLSYMDINEKGTDIRRYTITSFGKDGEADTPDDIKLTFDDNESIGESQLSAVPTSATWVQQ